MSNPQNRTNSGQKDRTPVRDSENTFPIDRSKVTKWIKEGLNNESIEWAKDFAIDALGGNFTTTQFRNIYSEIKKIESKGIFDAESKNRFLLLRPKVAYAVAKEKDRNKPDAAKKFEEFFEACYSGVDMAQPNTFQNFCYLIEAVLAFHKTVEK